MLTRKGECHQCGECCRTVNITAVRDQALKQHGNLKELTLYMSYRGIRVVGEDAGNNRLFYAMDIPCSQLDADNLCKVHNTPEKPLICYRYPWEKDDIDACGFSFEPGGGALPEGVEE